MARIYPQFIPDSERQANSGRRAEYLLYDQLDAQLGDDWLVLYSQAIKWAHKHGVSDREADFIVAHPKLGVVMIEVKGGSISREGGHWYSIPLSQLDRPQSQQEHHFIKDPYQQATDAAKAYERKLDDFVRNQSGSRSERLPARKFEIGTAVCFPDIEIPPSFHLAGDALPELTLSRKDLPNLKQRIFEMFKAYQGDEEDVPGEDGLRLLTEVLAKSWHIDSFISYQYEDSERQRKKLTEEQFELLYYGFESNPRMLISGCAGSGKTMMAAEIARRLVAEGQNVLFVCHNENLADWLRISPFAHDQIKFTHFHGLCQWAADRMEIDLPSWRDVKNNARLKNKFYSEDLPLALWEAVDKAGDSIRFDSIIVDEGQDFMVDWLQLMHDDLLRDKFGSKFYVFYDDNQRIYTRSDNKKLFDGFAHHYLSQNKRNTNQIFKKLKNYYFQKKKILPSGISGPDIRNIRVSGPDDAYQKLDRQLDDLLAQKFKLEDVILLTPRIRSTSIWQQKLEGLKKSRKYLPVWDLRLTGQRFSCCSIHQFKGLERPIVILSELESLSERSKALEMMYVAISRAKYELIILGDFPQISDDV